MVILKQGGLPLPLLILSLSFLYTHICIYIYYFYIVLAASSYAATPRVFVLFPRTFYICCSKRRCITLFFFSFFFLHSGNSFDIIGLFCWKWKQCFFSRYNIFISHRVDDQSFIWELSMLLFMFMCGLLFLFFFVFFFSCVL